MRTDPGDAPPPGGLASLGSERGRGRFWWPASSRSRSRWSDSSRCCFGRSSTLSSITTRRISSSSASSAVWRSRSAMRQARQPTGGGRPRTAPVAGIHGDRGLHGPPCLRNGGRPLLREPRRLPDRDPDRAARERILRFRLGVRRRASRPRAAVIRQRGKLRGALVIVMATWFFWTLANLPPLREPNSEAATGRVLGTLAILGTILFTVSAFRYWRLFRHRPRCFQRPSSPASCCSPRR